MHACACLHLQVLKICYLLISLSKLINNQRVHFYVSAFLAIEPVPYTVKLSSRKTFAVFQPIAKVFPLNHLLCTVYDGHGLMHCKSFPVNSVPYGAKRWRGKTLVNVAIVHQFAKVFPSKNC